MVIFQLMISTYEHNENMDDYNNMPIIIIWII